MSDSIPPEVASIPPEVAPTPEAGDPPVRDPDDHPAGPQPTSHVVVSVQRRLAATPAKRHLATGILVSRDGVLVPEISPDVLAELRAGEQIDVQLIAMDGGEVIDVDRVETRQVTVYVLDREPTHSQAGQPQAGQSQIGRPQVTATIQLARDSRFSPITGDLVLSQIEEMLDRGEGFWAAVEWLLPVAGRIRPALPDEAVLIRADALERRRRQRSLRVEVAPAIRIAWGWCDFLPCCLVPSGDQVPEPPSVQSPGFLSGHDGRH